MFICMCICICLCFCIFGRLHFLFFVRFFSLRPLSNCILNQLSNHVAVGWQTHLFSLKPAQTHKHTHTRAQSLTSLGPSFTSLYTSPPQLLMLLNTLTQSTKLTLPTTLSLSFSITLKCKSKCKSSPNFAFVSHHFPTPFSSPLSLFSRSLYKCCQTVSSDWNCHYSVSIGSFPTNFNVWKLSLNFEWQWGRVSEREGVERGGNWSELRLPISSLWLATCRLPTRTVLSACPPFHSTLALFSFPAVPLSPPLLFLCALCKLSPIHINHVASATQNTATY